MIQINIFRGFTGACKSLRRNLRRNDSVATRNGVCLLRSSNDLGAAMTTAPSLTVHPDHVTARRAQFSTVHRRRSHLFNALNSPRHTRLSEFNGIEGLVEKADLNC